MCRVFSCVVGGGCLLWPVCSLEKTLSAFALLHSVLQGQTCLLLQVALDFLLLHASPLWWKGHLFFFFFGISFRRSCRSSQNRSASSALVVGARPYITMILKGLHWKQTEVILSFWDCTQVLHFWLFCWLWWLLHFFLGILAHSSRYNGHLN